MWQVSFKMGFAFLALAAVAALFGFGAAGREPVVAARVILVVFLILAGTSFAAGWYVRRLERYNDPRP